MDNCFWISHSRSVSIIELWTIVERLRFLSISVVEDSSWCRGSFPWPDVVQFATFLFNEKSSRCDFLFTATPEILQFWVAVHTSPICSTHLTTTRISSGERRTRKTNWKVHNPRGMAGVAAAVDMMKLRTEEEMEKKTKNKWKVSRIIFVYFVYFCSFGQLKEAGNEGGNANY